MTGLDLRIDGKWVPRPGGGCRPVLADIALTIPAGQVCLLSGPSGIGKTTLLNIVAGLDRRFQGRIAFGAGRPRLGYLFQSPRLLPWLSVAQNIGLGLPRAERARAAAPWLEAIGLDGLDGLRPAQLSLGMARRVALARALAVDPDLLLLDEPFASLDDATAAAIRDLLARWLAGHSATVLMVTHQPEAAESLADRHLSLGGMPAGIRTDRPLPHAPTRRTGKPACRVSSSASCLSCLPVAAPRPATRRSRSAFWAMPRRR